SIDVLVAMAHRGANLERVAELARARRGARVSILTEDPEHAALARGLRPGLFVDPDPRMGRSGIALDDGAPIAAPVAACRDACRGLHAYEGHIRERAEAEREGACAPLFEAVARIARERRLERGEVVT